MAYGGPQDRGLIGAVAASLHHSSQQCQILNPLTKARDQTHNLMVTTEPQWVLLEYLFRLCTSLDMKWFSCMQHINGSFFFFNPFNPSSFWLKYLVHLHLKLLLICMYLLPFSCFPAVFGTSLVHFSSFNLFPCDLMIFFLFFCVSVVGFWFFVTSRFIYIDTHTHTHTCAYMHTHSPS